MDASQVTSVQIDDEICLRPFVADDALHVFNAVARNYGHLRTFMEWAKPDYSLADAEDFVTRTVIERADNMSLNFGIFRAGKLIGTIGYASFDHEAKVAEIGYWIDRDEEGKGIVGNACKRLLEMAFNEFGLNRVQIRCASGNVRSAAIPERFAFKKEGVQREHVMRDGIIYDFVIYGLLASEWRQFN